LIATTCSLVLQTKKFVKIALEILEQECKVILDLLINDRSDTFKLNAIYSQLFAHYENLGIRLNKFVENVTNRHLRKITFTRRTNRIIKLKKCI